MKDEFKKARTRRFKAERVPGRQVIIKNNSDKVPAEAQADLLSTPDLVKLVISSTKLYRFYQPLLRERQLLHHVVHGNQAQASTLLSQDINLLFVKSIVTDLLGRTFVGISASDYMLWALESSQFYNMLSCLPQTEQGKQEAEKLRTQYNDPAHQLLLHVVRGEHDAVSALLKQNPNLPYKKSSVIDLSGRVFNNISSFEYACWALDSHIWKTMLNTIPKNKQGDEVLVQLGVQYRLLSQGLTYQLYGIPFTESHFNFEQTIIKELQTQVDLQHAKGDKNWDSINKQWIEGVGRAQRLLPVHVVNEYCAKDRSFTTVPNIPDFTTYLGPSQQFYNWLTYENENWFKSGSKLGITFAVYRGWRAIAGARNSVNSMREVDIDLVALKELYKVRTNDFTNLDTLFEVTPDRQSVTFHAIDLTRC